MKTSKSVIIGMVISVLVFGFSCQGTQKTKKERKSGELQEATESREDEEDENWEKDEEEKEDEDDEVVFNFDKDPEGAIPKGWSSSKTGKGNLGRWVVVKDDSAPSKPNVLAQKSKENLGYHFSIAVADETQYSDVEIELMFKAVDGQEDQGGGPVWRYVDADNYYVCRANPLENNFRVYKVVDGNRLQLESASVTIPSNQWHIMKIEHVGNHIKCWLNGKMYLDVEDDTFQEGKVGLWTKADAVTYFDNVEIETED